MKIFLFLLKYTDFILLQATSEDYLQLPVIASVVSSISSASRTWKCLKTHCSRRFPQAVLCCCLSGIWPEILKKKNYIHTVLNSCQTIFTPWFYLIFKASQWSSQEKTDHLFIDNRCSERQWGLLKTDRYWSWNARLLVAKPMFLLSSLAAFLVVSVCRADRAVGC